jgi:hypothetical protein
MDVEDANPEAIQSGKSGENQGADDMDVDTYGTTVHENEDNIIRDLDATPGKGKKRAMSPRGTPRIKVKPATPGKGKKRVMSPRGRKRSRSPGNVSSDSRHSKATRRSLSSAAMSVPRSPTPSEVSLEGASRTTGGLFRGKALGDVFNMADACKWFDYSYLCWDQLNDVFFQMITWMLTKTLGKKSRAKCSYILIVTQLNR